MQGAGAKEQKQGQGQVAAPSPGGRVIESSKLEVCWAGSVLNTLLSRHVREEINQLLIYLGGQILLFNCFFNLESISRTVCSDVTEVSDLCCSLVRWDFPFVTSKTVLCKRMFQLRRC